MSLREILGSFLSLAYFSISFMKGGESFEKPI